MTVRFEKVVPSDVTLPVYANAASRPVIAMSTMKSPAGIFFAAFVAVNLKPPIKYPTVLNEAAGPGPPDV